MRFAIFSQATGQIERIVDCPIEVAAEQLQAGEAVIPMAQGDDVTHYVANGDAVPIPVQPSVNHAFDWVTKQWFDPRSLQDFKDVKWTAIKTARETAIDAPLVTPYGTVDSKARDRTNITDAVLMLQTLVSIGQPTTIDFTLADNTTVTLTTAEMVTIGLLLGQKVQAAHSTARMRRAQIDAALTAQEIALIVW